MLNYLFNILYNNIKTFQLTNYTTKFFSFWGLVDSTTIQVAVFLWAINQCQ